MSKLVIVESPTKAGSIKGYLGSDYKVVASQGHIRDLPKSKLGIDTEDHFKPHYINIRGKGDLIRELKKDAKKADKIYLATDLDREGEAISWHLANVLGIDEKSVCRITFNEVTKSAVKEAIKKPRTINMDLVNAQQARRILDRIVGYKLSPFLWKTVKSGLSAGRVQSVATRVIVDRENEIRAFIPSEYWTIDAELTTPKDKPLTVHFYGNKDGKIELKNEDEVNAVIEKITGKPYTASEIKKGTRFKTPAPPFTTSTMQQEASLKLNFQSQRTMKIAQELYEGIDLGSAMGGTQGLITYMRTDSLRVSADAQAQAGNFIKDRFGEKYSPETPRVYKSKANSQDAHEAIRPVSIMLEPQKIKKQLTSDQYRLYKLIWDRYTASQMSSAELSTVSVDFDCEGYIFRASGYSVKFNGFLAVYEESHDEAEAEKKTAADGEKNIRIPTLNEGDVLECTALLPEQHFTEPPPRYTEASLIKFFEETGIGRPSTYTPIITIIISRGYVVRENKSLVPTPLGEVTVKLMTEYFPDIVDYKFTAMMESSLDQIEEGKTTMETVLEGFYGGFEKSLENAESTVKRDEIEVPVEETDIICEHCGAKMIVKNGRYGKFAACPNYPECKNTKPLNKKTSDGDKKPEIADFKCELCGSDMVLRTGKYGSFYACVRYPDCKFTKQKQYPLGVNCPKCGADIVTKFGRNKNVYYSCSRYPECDFSSWDKPTNEKCPECGGMLYLKKGKSLLVCTAEGCGYKREAPQQENVNKDDAIKDESIDE